MSYQTGMLVWGSSKSVGNVWIVTDAATRAISLVRNGKAMQYCRDFGTTKHDFISPTSFLYEVTTNELARITATHGPLPQWALDLVYARITLPQGSQGLRSGPAPQLIPAVVQKVEQALGVNLTDKPERVILRKDADKCPVNGGLHQFTPYTGLVQSFEYCVYCDMKRGIVQ